MIKRTSILVHSLSGWMVLLVTLFLGSGCDSPGLEGGAQVDSLERTPVIFPDYAHVTIPGNIAPLNFVVKEEGERFRAVLEGENGRTVQVKSRGSQFQIPRRQWSRFLLKNQGSSFTVQVFRKGHRSWTGFKPFEIHVALETIDPYLVYRLIPPGYETWSSMGLYERDLTSFRQKPIIENRNIEDNCINCHSFSSGSSENMLFHIRGSIGGTIIRQGDEIGKVDLKREETLSAGVYPSWHPSGKYIAFSTNRIEQYFHARREKTIEVLDRQSDLILYNTASGIITHVPGTAGDRFMETYPSWSPDGRSLYFSRTDADASTPFDSIRYDIFRMAFDPAKGTFGDAEPVYLASQEEKSASFPRISPDGKYLLCTLHDYGTFPIWHKEADLCLVDLITGVGEVQGTLNSEDTDSYHSWARNSRWIVFSSRRLDGRYTKLYLSYMNREGQFQKPFLLPQRDPGMYDTFFYSYNRPELITGPVDVKARSWVRAVRGK